MCNEIKIEAPLNLRYIYDLEPVKTRILRKCREEWKDAAEEMPKLSTYCQIKDFTEPAVMVRSNIHRNGRSVLSRLPLKVKTGRYNKKNKVDRNIRFCQVCGKDEVEDEIHLIFICSELKPTCKEHLKPLLKSSRETTSMSNTEKLQWLLHKDKIKEFSAILSIIFNARQNKMYRTN